MIDPRNARSLAVAKRLGMDPRRDDVLLGVAVVVHAITREDWGATGFPAYAARAGAPGQPPSLARAPHAP